MLHRLILALPLLLLVACSNAPTPSLTPEIETPSPEPVYLPLYPGGADDLAAEARRVVSPLSAESSQATLRLGKGRASVMAASPDGRWLAIGGLAGITVYHAATLTEHWSAIVDADTLGAIVFSPDSETLIVGGDDQQLTRFSLEDGALIDKIDIPFTFVMDLDVSADGRFIAVGGDNRVHLVDAGDGTILWRESRIAPGPQAVAFSPNGAQIAAGWSDGSLIIYDTSSAETVYRRELGGAVIGELAWSPDANTVYAALLVSNQVALVDLQETRQPTDNAPDDEALSAEVQPPIRLLAGRRFLLAPDGENILLGSLEGEIRRRDLASGQTQQRYTQLADWTVELAWINGASAFAALDRSGTVTLWDYASAEMLARLTDHMDQPGTQLDYSLDGEHIVAGDIAGQISIWSLETQSRISHFQAHQGAILALDYSFDGQFLLTAGEDDVVQVWDAETLLPIERWINDTGETLVTAQWHQADGSIFIALRGGVLLWRPNRNVDGFQYPRTDQVNSFDAWFGPTIGPLRQAYGSDSTVAYFLDPQVTGDWSRLEAPVQLYGVSELAWSPDGLKLAGTAGGRLTVWRPSNVESEVLYHERGPGNALAWSRDSQYVLSGSTGGGTSILITHVESGAVTTLSGHAGPIRDLVRSPSGEQFASIGHDGTIILWDWSAVLATALNNP
ncbi:MAG: WD40 repeat domain-containing protein [Chloroflexi bacterium]|nr:WD40 repeat domain-containing protein [Chloroflexota bacterium]